MQKSWARLIAAPPAAQPNCAIGICRVSDRNPILLISHAVSDGIRNPVHDTYMITSMSCSVTSAFARARSMTSGHRFLDSNSYIRLRSSKPGWRSVFSMDCTICHFCTPVFRISRSAKGSCGFPAWTLSANSRVSSVVMTYFGTLTDGLHSLGMSGIHFLRVHLLYVKNLSRTPDAAQLASMVQGAGEPGYRLCCAGFSRGVWFADSGRVAVVPAVLGTAPAPTAPGRASCWIAGNG